MMGDAISWPGPEPTARKQMPLTSRDRPETKAESNDRADEWTGQQSPDTATKKNKTQWNEKKYCVPAPNDSQSGMRDSVFPIELIQALWVKTLKTSSWYTKATLAQPNLRLPNLT